MKTLLVRTAAVGAAVLAVALTGCSADPLSVVILNARAPGDKCDFPDDTKYVSGGSVDFRPYGTTGGGTTFTNFYGQVFSWQNNMLSAPLVVNGQTVDPATGNDFIADQAILSYQYSDPNVSLPGETENLRAVIAAGCTPDKCSVGVALIGAGAADILNNTLTAIPHTLLVTFHLTGATAGGRATHTNDVSFPLTVYRSDTTPLICPTGTKLYTGPCLTPGRDAPVQCVPAS